MDKLIETVWAYEHLCNTLDKNYQDAVMKENVWELNQLPKTEVVNKNQLNKQLIKIFVPGLVHSMLYVIINIVVLLIKDLLHPHKPHHINITYSNVKEEILNMYVFV